MADEVGDRRTLELLAALVEADSLATGPSAWGPWKAGLVADLVERTRRVLAGEPVAPTRPRLTEDVRVIMDTVRAQGVPALAIDRADGDRGRPRPFRPAGPGHRVLALHGLNVRSADITGEDGVAVEIFTVEPERGRWPAVGPAVGRPGRGDQRQAARRGAAGRSGPHLPGPADGGPHLVSTQVTVDNNASTWPRWSRSGPRTSSASSTGLPGPSSTVAST